MSAAAPTAPTAPGARSWWGIPYATAERYRRPVVANFDPNLPYDRKGVVSVQPGIVFAFATGEHSRL
ncbi:hypothetical protein [Streptomyces rubrogriseus]|uniref:hypothetical protein n=1 Tax=Streptomyces rubrogriseus TaxID=194673 RepID=UPI001FD31130|nr:hypothetical protein [Streptomyces rubrogriseus]